MYVLVRVRSEIEVRAAETVFRIGRVRRIEIIVSVLSSEDKSVKKKKKKKTH